MGNPIKYSATVTSGSYQKGNNAIGVNPISYGPTSTTGWYNSPTPSGGNFIVTEVVDGNTPPRFYAPTTLTDWVNLARQEGATGAVTGSIANIRNWFSTQSNYIVTNIDFPSSLPNITTNGLLINLNTKIPTSYPGSGTTWTDVSGFNSNGTLYNGPTFTNNSLVFDGVDDYMQANITTTALDGDPSFTVDMVVKRTQGTNIGPTSGFWGIGGAGQGNSVQGWTPTSNLIHLDVYDSTRLTTDQYYPENRYIHLAWTKNGPGQETTNVKCYINGVEYGLTKTRSATRTNQFNTSTNGIGVCLGRINADASSFQTPITVNAFRVYNNALSQAEILQNYYQGNIVTDGLVMAVDAGNLISYESGSSTTYSLTGSFNGSLTNGTSYNSGDGGVWNFDGVDDYIEFPFETILNDCSVEMWFKATSTRIYQYPLAIRNNGVGNSYAFYLDINDPDGSGFAQTMWSYWNSGGSPYSVVPKTGTYGDWNDSTWRHYVFTRSTTVAPYTEHYMNGVKVTNVSRNGDQTTQFGNGAGYKLYLGQYGAGALYYPGYQAIVRIYNKTLSSAEVIQNFNAQRSRFGI